MGQYVDHVGVAYVKSLAIRHIHTDEASIVVQTARAKNDKVPEATTLEDKVLTAVANRLGYLARYQKLSDEQEVMLLAFLSSDEWAPVLDAVQEDGVKALRRLERGLN